MSNTSRRSGQFFNFILNIKTATNSFLKNGDERTLQIKKNILFSILLKGGSVLITLILIPLTIHYINPVQYGIWLIISSIITWLNIFDIGIGNALKNEIAICIATKNEKNIKNYISTTYAVLSIIAFLIFILFVFISEFVNWNSILNISPAMQLNIRMLLILLMACFCFQFVLQLINSVLNATQQVFKSSIILFISQFFTLIIIYFLNLFGPKNLTILVVVLAGTPIIILLIASLYLYKNELIRFKPTIKYVDFKYIKKLLNIGGAFFIIQMGAMVLFQTDNIIITRVMGPEAVTTFNIPFKLFSFISMVFAIVIVPFWSAFTDAYATKDFKWIIKNIKRIRIIWLALSIAALLLYIASDAIYTVWIGSPITIPKSLSFCMFLYVVIFMWHTLHVYFLNGVGIIRLQLVLVTVAAVINIPLAIYLGKICGLSGIISANTIVFFIMGVVYTIQCNKIITKKATKIWAK